MKPRTFAEGAVICQRRGYCGPFEDQARYDAVPGWEGLGTCLVCGSTVHTGHHEQRRRERERAAAPERRPRPRRATAS